VVLEVAVEDGAVLVAVLDDVVASFADGELGSGSVTTLSATPDDSSLLIEPVPSDANGRAASSTSDMATSPTASDPPVESPSTPAAD